MSFKVTDLMISVSPWQNENYTCTLVTRPTGGACIDTAFDHARRAKHELAVLKTQLRSATRA